MMPEAASAVKKSIRVRRLKRMDNSFPIHKLG